MIEVKKAITIEEKDIVSNAMVGIGGNHMPILYGLWEDGKCVGGAGLGGTFTNEFYLGVTVKPSIYLDKALCYILSEMLKVQPSIKGCAYVLNVKSKKLSKKLGFKHLYTIEDIAYFELSSLSDKLKRRWGD